MSEPPDHGMSVRPSGPAPPSVNPRLAPRAPDPLDVESLFDGVQKRNRVELGRAFTLVESTRVSDRPIQLDLLDRCQPAVGRAFRLAISGAPGAGKSTLIEAIGQHLTGRGLRVAVLAVDPSSERSGGSILGDKTRMPRLATDPEAFIRPSPTGGTLGGVTRGTRAALAVCDAAGFDVVLVETVGVGQSETAVRHMVDGFVLLALAGAGDELQGIKRGIIEAADLLVVSKADGDGIDRARRAASQLRSALRLLPGPGWDWKPPVVTCSALSGDSVAALWKEIERFREAAVASGSLEGLRVDQAARWFREEVDARLRSALYDDSETRIRVERLEEDVRAGRLHPFRAADVLLRGAG